MTRDEILTMPAGRKMNALIAVKIMGICPHDWQLENNLSNAQHVCLLCGQKYYAYNPPVTPDYSTDMTAAWQVVEKLSKPHIFINLSKFGDKYVCDIENMEDYSNPEKQFNRWKIDFCNSPALAICRAALLMTIGGEE
jgi:hypothetical protein